MLSELLKDETKNNHQQLEKKLVTKMRAMRSKADYAELLGIFYSYFGGLELLINQHIDTLFLPDYSERRKTASLVNDITALGGELPQLTAENSLPRIKNNAQALGALYVIEGSTLGGQIITQMIKKQLGANEGTSFFESYGDRTMTMWAGFKQALDNSGQLDANEVVQAANETFLKFSEQMELVS